MSKQQNPGALKQELLDLIHGLTTDPPGGQASLIIGGMPVPVTDLVAELNGYAQAYQEVEDAEQGYQSALAVRTAIEQQADARRKLVKAAIKGALGKGSPELAKFGMSPDKPPHALSVDEMQRKVAQAKATRAARHTMGKKQKLQIKGELPPPAPPEKAAP